MSWESPVTGNIDYYSDHPDMFTPAKIQKETWLPQRVRARIAIYLYETTGYGERKAKRRQARRLEIQGIAPAPEKKSRRRFKFILDKRRVSHKVDIRTGKYVHLNKAEQARRDRAIKKGKIPK